MKVIHVDSERTWRGGQQQVAYLVEGMLEQGHTPIVAARKGSELEKRMREIGVQVLPLNYVAGGIVGAKQLNAFCRQNQIDFVHVHSSRAHSLATLASLLGKFAPIIVSKRTDFPVKASGFSHWKYKSARVKKILCVSERIAEIAKKTLGPDGRVVAVHSGVDPDRFDVEKKNLRAEVGLADDTILIGNTSAIADQKDYFTFIRTAKRLLEQRPELRFVIFGDGPMSEQIKNFAKEQGVEKEVIFTGFRNDLPALLPNLDLFLMTSKTEGLGTSLLDAMICRVPIVATRTGGIPEIVRHEKTGLIAEVGDVDELARLSARMLEDKELRDRLVENAYSMATRDFHRKMTARKTIEIYESLLDQTPQKKA